MKTRDRRKTHGRARRDKPRPLRGVTRRARVATAEPQIAAVRQELTRLARRGGPPRWNADPDDVRRSVIQLVLTLVELIRQLLERQAIRRMEAGTLDPDETEAVGLALMRLAETIREIGEQFDLAPEDLNLDLGPIGRLI